MSQVTTIGLDIAKNVFHAHGVDERGAMVFSRKLTKAKLLEFFAGQPACVVAMEVCSGAHHWARQLQTMVARGAADPACLREAVREAEQE